MLSRLLSAFLLTVLVCSVAVEAAEKKSPWLTDYPVALKEAGATNRPVLLNFTGSDWCSWCLRLDKETFSQPKFTAFARDNLILLEVDFPQGKEQSAAVKKQNGELQRKFGVEGFPTLVLLDKDGKELARQPGYLEGGPDAMIAWINRSQKKE